MKKIILSTASLLLLTGCVSQEQVDAKITRGCEAGVNSLLGSAKILKVNTKNYSFEENSEGQHRRVTLETVTKDGWLEVNKTYSCLFAQQWGFFKTSHAAILVQIKMPDGKIIGKKGSVIQGSIDDFMKLTDTVQEAMGQK